MAREYKTTLNTRRIVSLIAVRRSGKTSLLFKLTESLRVQVGRLYHYAQRSGRIQAAF